MKKTILSGLVSALIMLGIVTAAQATTITFDDLETPSVGDNKRWDLRNIGPYSYDGYTISTAGIETWPDTLIYPTQSSFAYRNSVGIGSAAGNESWLVLYRQDGGLFDFDELQVRRFYAQQQRFEFNAYDQVGGLISTRTIDTSNDLLYEWTTIIFDSSFDSVARVEWRSWVKDSGYNNMNLADNIVVTAVNPVPEPSTVFLIGVGLAGLAGFSRNRKS